MVLVGAGLGALAFALVRALVPQRASVDELLARFDARPPTRLDASARRPGPLARARVALGSSLVRALARRGITHPRLRQDLALAGVTFEEVMARKAMAFVSGFV